MMSSDRIRPVENNYWFPHLHTCLHAEFHRPYEGVVPCTDILHIDCHCVNVLQHRRLWFARAAIETEYRKAGLFIDESFPFHHIVLRLAADSVLRTKEGLEFEIARTVK